MKYASWNSAMVCLTPFLMGLVAAFALNPAYGDEQKSIDPTKDHQVSIAVGTEAIAKLPRAGGTGYFWNARSNSTKIVGATELNSGPQQGRSDSTDLVGAAEMDSFVILGRKPGTTYVDFTLQRVRSAPEERHTLTVIVR